MVKMGRVTIEDLAMMTAKGFREAEENNRVKFQEMESKIGALAALMVEVKSDIRGMYTDLEEVKITTRDIHSRQEIQLTILDDHEFRISQNERKLRNQEPVS